ncbi:hypothetical protein OG21DRAFT_1510909 [Imleria badia]|nr:hypothetical protein OG21DRAFT_1510909 [Imleria badia]
MHRVLLLEEILHNIFSYLPFQPSIPLFPGLRFPSRNFDLIALARTSKAFKEPALDILWVYLPDLTPLVRCLPEASWVNPDGVYSFNRQLEKADWDIILGYARRVRALPHLRGSFGLAADCLEVLSKPPSPTVPIFPKLRDVGLYMPTKEISRFVRQLISPRLTRLYIGSTENLGNVIDAFGEGCPNVESFKIGQWANPDTISSLICHWQKLCSVDCLPVDLNPTAISHLSRLHNLRHLRFKLHDEAVDWIQSFQSGTSMLTLSALRGLALLSGSLASGLNFLHHLRLPLLNDLSVHPRVIPTMPDLMSFLAMLQETCAHNTLNNFKLILGDSEFDSDDSEVVEDYIPYHITFDHLHPLTAFVNIRSINVDICCGVDLNERELLRLASSWPYLEHFLVCDYKHWTASSAITPGGFVQLLGECRSLHSLHFKFDTRGYTEIPQGHPWCGLSMPKGAHLHLQSSPIEEESIHALGVFFHVAPYPDFRMRTYWNDPDFRDSETSEELCDLYHDRWERAHSLTRRLSEEREKLRRSLAARFSDSDVL